MTSTVEWFELWVDASAGDGWIYVLILRGSSDGSLELIEPQKGGERVDTFGNHEDAVHWLSEDEYELVEGRPPGITAQPAGTM
ncbi:uncharacterized protein SOCE26_079570 [Sorangium cellulosum]|uniref:Uncharacterized protein n=1 Tax=Sorangium cellulosum TaxID=56 RepID=A0A2L0F4N0_SORCE|nr:hypothetical protein [Sorangium cellulosum]AUX46451.1 uncharacterized protein SOCE26_079570 [Sorangium cellulosum]